MREISCVLIACLCPGFFLPAVAEERKLPPPAQVKVDFRRDIEPIFEQSCYKCHGAEKPKSGFDLTTRAAVLKGGENGVAIIAGDSGKSPLIQYVAGTSDEMDMPPAGKAPALTAEQVSLLRAWIDQGVNYPALEPATPQFSISPAIRWTTVRGNTNAFREQFWRKQGFGAGVDYFELHDQPADDVAIDLDGHTMSDDQAIAVRLAVARKNFGFVHFGYEQYQQYFDDTGGYAPLLPVHVFSLDRDLTLDVGRAWIDFGLAVPDKPAVTIGYEYQFRNGNISTLQWGPVGTMPAFANPTDAKNIFPAAQNIDEKIHILKLDISDEINGWYFEDNARVEFYDLKTINQNGLSDTTLSSTPNTIARLNQEQQQTSGANTFHVDKQLLDWWFASAGYLYTKLGGDASLQLNTLTGAGAPTFGDQWIGTQILLDRESHSGSIASLFGPWEGLTLSTAVQGEWSRQRAMGDANFAVGNPTTPPLFSIPVSNEGNIDDATVRENLALRYTAVPFTTVYAETRLQQENLSRFVEQIGGFEPFRTDTDADINQIEYRTGFDTSPWQRVSFGAYYKRNDKQTDYTYPTHFTSGLGYPGFFFARNITTDEVEPRIVLRPVSWLRATLSYRWTATDFNNVTRGAIGGSPIFAGNSDDNVYSANLVLTPIRRLYLSSTFSYTDSRTVTAQNGANYLASWKGNVYNVLSSATYALNTSTDLTASYNFSSADFGQESIAATGLPIGIIYHRNVVEAGISHYFKNGVGAGFRYGFYQYSEPSSGGANNFTAQSIFGMITLKL